MLRISGHRLFVDLADLAAGFYQFERIEEVTARVALVAARVVITATRTCALDEAVRQEGLVVVAEGLDRGALLEVVVVPQLGEDVLDDLRVVFRRCSTEVVTVMTHSQWTNVGQGSRQSCRGYGALQRQVEPVVNILVLDEEAVAKLLWRDTLLQGSRFCCRTVLVGTADVKRRVAALSAVTREAVGREGRAYNIAQVRYVVDVRELERVESQPELPARPLVCAQLTADVMSTFFLPLTGRIFVSAIALQLRRRGVLESVEFERRGVATHR